MKKMSGQSPIWLDPIHPIRRATQGYCHGGEAPSAAPIKPPRRGRCRLTHRAAHQAGLAVTLPRSGLRQDLSAHRRLASRRGDGVRTRVSRPLGEGPPQSTSYSTPALRSVGGSGPCPAGRVIPSSCT